MVVVQYDCTSIVGGLYQDCSMSSLHAYHLTPPLVQYLQYRPCSIALLIEYSYDRCIVALYVGHIQVVLVIQYREHSNSPSKLAWHCNVVVLQWYCNPLGSTMVVLQQDCTRIVGGLYQDCSMAYLHPLPPHPTTCIVCVVLSSSIGHTIQRAFEQSV